MKTPLISTLLIAIFIVFLLEGCKKENCAQVFSEGIVAIDKVSSGTVNTNIPVTVYWEYTNGCMYFDHFENKQMENTLSISTYIADGETCGRTCTQDAATKTAIYNFKTSVAGTYYLKFIDPMDNTTMVDTIQIH